MNLCEYDDSSCCTVLKSSPGAGPAGGFLHVRDPSYPYAVTSGFSMGENDSNDSEVTALVIPQASTSTFMLRCMHEVR